jgi:hypothetical protein
MDNLIDLIFEAVSTLIEENSTNQEKGQNNAGY